MNLQFADINGDGHKDIITATFEGTAMMVPGGKDGWGAPRHLKDASGRNIIASLFYDMKKNNYFSEDRSADGETFHSDDHCVSTTALDWDQDGDLDLILGAKEGRLYRRMNLGSATNPRFEDVNRLIKAGGEDLLIPKGATAAQPVDWDQDGDIDLLCGSFGGGLFFVENTGDDQELDLETPVQVMSPRVPFGDETVSSKDWYATPVDFDKDGKLDLLVGMQLQIKPAAVELTDVEKQKLETTKARIEELNAKAGKIFEKFEMDENASQEEMQKLFEKMESDPDYLKINEQMSALHEVLFELEPMPTPKAGVWLYRRL